MDKNKLNRAIILQKNIEETESLIKVFQRQKTVIRIGFIFEYVAPVDNPEKTTILISGNEAADRIIGHLQKFIEEMNQELKNEFSDL